MAAKKKKQNFAFIDPNELEIRGLNQREFVRDESFEELTRNIESNGIAQPVTVRPVEEGKYELVCGERRVRAAIDLGLAEVPCYIKELTDEQASEHVFVENNFRKDMTAMEEAKAFQMFLDRYGYDLDKLSENLGKSVDYIKQSLSLLNLCEPMQELLENGTLSKKAASLMSKYNPDIQMDNYEKHFAPNVGGWASWKDLNYKEMKERAEHENESSLEAYDFDKTECLDCSSNSNHGMLLNKECGVCGNIKCLKSKMAAHNLAKAEAIRELVPEAEGFAASRYNSDDELVEALKEKGYEVSELETCRYPWEINGFSSTRILNRVVAYSSASEDEEDDNEGYSYDDDDCADDEWADEDDGYGNDEDESEEETCEEASDSSSENGESDGERDSEEDDVKPKTYEEIQAERKAAIDERIKNNDSKLYIVIGCNEIYLGYTANTPAEMGTDKIGAANKRMERFKVIRVENTVRDSYKALEEAGFKDIPLSEAETRFIYRYLLDHQNNNHLGKHIEATQYGYIDENSKEEFIKDLTEEKKNLILRGFLLGEFKAAFGPSVLTDRFMEFARQHIPEKVAAIESKHEEILKKREISHNKKVATLLGEKMIEEGKPIGRAIRQ